MKRIPLLIGIVACILITLLAVVPLLVQAYYCILDCSRFYEVASTVRLLDPRTYLAIDFLENRARPGTFILLFPAYFIKSATLHYWFQTVALLSVPCLMMYWIVWRVTGRAWLALLAIAACVSQPSFTENYYTLFKAEPWIMTGCFVVTFVLWCQLYTGMTWRASIVPHLLAVLAVAMIYTLKEPGGAFIGVYVAGLLVLLWGSEYASRRCLKRTLLLTLLNVIGFGILLVSVARLKSLYSASGISEYSVKPAALVAGVQRVGLYFLASAPYLIPTMVLLCVALLVLGSPGASAALKKRLRVGIAWTGYMLLLVAGMVGALVPWQTLETRQYLAGAAAAPIAAVFGMHLGMLARSCASRWMTRMLLAGCVGISALLLVLQSIFAVVTGPVSEGMARYRYDQSYDALFRYVAAAAPTNGVVYFLMDALFAEPQINSEIGMRVFYGRPDMRCFYPTQARDFGEPGIVAVSQYGLAMNYDRMPVQHEANAQFYDRMARSLPLTMVTQWVDNTTVYFVTNTYHGPQHAAVAGIPALWRLQRGNYRFGWTIYAVSNVPVVLAQAGRNSTGNLLANGNFGRGLAAWSAWGVAEQHSNQVRVVRANADAGSAYALRVENSGAALLGMKQHVPLVSGAVYRVSATVRSVATTAPHVLFGGRVALFLLPQPELQIVWVSEYDKWWPKTLVFTNQVTGMATVYVHMGYGNVGSTGEFTNICLEQIK